MDVTADTINKPEKYHKKLWHKANFESTHVKVVAHNSAIEKAKRSQSTRPIKKTFSIKLPFNVKLQFRKEIVWAKVGNIENPERYAVLELEEEGRKAFNAEDSDESWEDCLSEPDTSDIPDSSSASHFPYAAGYAGAGEPSSKRKENPTDAEKKMELDKQD